MTDKEQDLALMALAELGEPEDTSAMDLAKILIELGLGFDDADGMLLTWRLDNKYKALLKGSDNETRCYSIPATICHTGLPGDHH